MGVAPLVPQGDQYIGNVTTTTALNVCHHLPGLVQQQVSVCQSHPDTLSSISDGARLGISECQYQFRKERWNCTTTYTDPEVPFGNVIKKGQCTIISFISLSLLYWWFTNITKNCITYNIWKFLYITLNDIENRASIPFSRRMFICVCKNWVRRMRLLRDGH